MTPLFKKLNLKDQSEILIINPPESFKQQLALLKGVAVIDDLDAIQTVCFSLAFVTKQAELDDVSEGVVAKISGDAVIWFAYPKGTSKKYKCEFNRDTGWRALGALGFEPVSIVAIDEDWSALRFRRVEFIATMRRNSKMAISEAGRKKLNNEG
jgi:hypothetical protein